MVACIRVYLAATLHKRSSNPRHVVAPFIHSCPPAINTSFLSTPPHTVCAVARVDCAAPTECISVCFLPVCPAFVSAPFPSLTHTHAGRLVVELFEDVAPAAARHLLTRCTQGSGASVQGSLFHKLLAGYGLFGGKR